MIVILNWVIVFSMREEEEKGEKREEEKGKRNIRRKKGKIQLKIIYQKGNNVYIKSKLYINENY